MVTFTYKDRNYVFRNPEMGNVDEINFQRINRNSRGGDLIIFRDDNWPKTELQNITFNFGCQADLDRMFSLIKDSFGDILTYRDHENKVWQGIIQNPETTGVQAARNDWTINLIFQGNLV